MSDQNQRFTIDYTLIFLVLLLGIISFLALYTVQPTLPAKYEIFNFPFRQIQWYVIGSVIIFFTMLIDYDRFRKITWIIYPIGLIPLIMIFFRVPANLMVEFNDIV